MAALNGDINNDFMGVCGLDDSRWNASKKVIGNINDNPELLKGGNQGYPAAENAPYSSTNALMVMVGAM
jgi:hypothetical protein